MSLDLSLPINCQDHIRKEKFRIKTKRYLLNRIEKDLHTGSLDQRLGLDELNLQVPGVGCVILNDLFLHLQFQIHRLVEVVELLDFQLLNLVFVSLDAFQLFEGQITLSLSSLTLDQKSLGLFVCVVSELLELVDSLLVEDLELVVVLLSRGQFSLQVLHLQ